LAKPIWCVSSPVSPFIYSTQKGNNHMEEILSYLFVKLLLQIRCRWYNAIPSPVNMAYYARRSAKNPSQPRSDAAVHIVIKAPNLYRSFWSSTSYVASMSPLTLLRSSPITLIETGRFAFESDPILYSQPLEKSLKNSDCVSHSDSVMEPYLLPEKNIFICCRTP